VVAEPAERALAAQQGALDDAPPRATDVARIADLLVLAAPPAANLAQLEAVAPHLKAGALVTDVGSVKRGIVARAERLVSGVDLPAAIPWRARIGTASSGPYGPVSRAIVYVTPCSDGGDAAGRSCTSGKTCWALKPSCSTPGCTTHSLPRRVTSRRSWRRCSRLPGSPRAPGVDVRPGAADTTRLAASEPALWTEILLMNRDEILPALRALEESLGTVERALEVGDAAALTAWLTRAASWRRRIGSP